MTVKQQWAIVAIVVAVMAGALRVGSYVLRDELRQIAVGSKAPDFTAKTIDVSPVTKTLENYKGEVILLNVWTTTCPPCRQEMPNMEKLYSDYKSKGLKIVAVSVDPPGMEQAIRDFKKEFNLSFDILYDASGAIEQSYQTTGWPESFVIARDGTIHKKWIGEDNWNSQGNRRLFEQLLAAK
ncbi:MAG: TlpA family protein disulfide reductase [Phycisphaerae bacterium]|nr:TlpA family protein disulfide reductase [Gemmatimonadaceae bacterium]